MKEIFNLRYVAKNTCESCSQPGMMNFLERVGKWIHNLRKVCWWVVTDDQSGWPVSWRSCERSRIKSLAGCDGVKYPRMMCISEPISSFGQ